MRWRFFTGEAFQSIRGNVATTVAASITVLIVTFLLGVFASLFLWVRDKTEDVRGDVTVKVYMPRGTEQDPATLDTVRNQIADIPNVKSIEYVSPEDAIQLLDEEARKQIGVLSFNPLPPAFYVKVVDPEKAGEVRDAALQIPQVANCGSEPCADYGEEVTERVLFVTKVILIVMGALMILLGVAAVVLIANTIRLSIFSRRREIEVMKLVGATNWFVRVPFMLEGMLTGLLGAIGAVVLLALMYVFLGTINSDLTEPAQLYPGGVVLLSLTLAGFGLVLGAFGSGMTLRRFLRV
jgi:cell division transport system permease protein